MYYDVNKARYLGGYKLEITFKNGRSGIVDFKKFIKRGGVFSKLAKSDFFKKFDINRELGVITWGNEVDIAPETLYAEATQEPVAEWVEVEEKSYNKGKKLKTIRYIGGPYSGFDKKIQNQQRAEGWKSLDQGYNGLIRDLRFIKEIAA